MHGLPVFAVCGWSGAGKTTLLEAAIPRLIARGLSVAVMKHDAHGLSIDTPGKDSDRLFRAGADVLVNGPGEDLARYHRHAAAPSTERLAALAADHDLVLLEGHRASPFPKVWLASEDDVMVPGDVTGLIAVLPRDPGPSGGPRVTAFLDIVLAWLAGEWRARELIGAILIGGRSSRMGSPKQLVHAGGMTLFERASRALAPLTSRVLAIGAGDLPPGHDGVARLADPPGITGPAAGILAALRWAPRATLLVTACDHPLVSQDGLRWLVDERAPGRWLIMPCVSEDAARVEPFPGIYEPASRPLLEQIAPTGGPSALRGGNHVHSPRVPAGLQSSWRNANRPEDLPHGG